MQVIAVEKLEFFNIRGGVADNQQVTKKVFSMYPSMYLSMYFLKSLPSQRNTRNTTIKCPPKGNKFKKSNVEAFFYWNEIQRLM